MGQQKFAVIGLGVMGANLARNFARQGFETAVFNHNPGKMRKFVTGLPQDSHIQGFETIEEVAQALEKPRRILLMVPAGPPVDEMIDRVKPFLSPGDILIDGGNSYFPDTDRRNQELQASGIHFIGMGVSGGEEGALWGPSMMPGGQTEAWEAMKEMLQAVSAKAEDGQPCVALIGPRGAGHYVKMVHNGIEYGDMQLIAEIYDLLHRGLELSASELADIFNRWNQDFLHSYLIEITAQVMRKQDDLTGQPLVDMILDEAQQKGTGKWTSQNALDVGAPIPTIDAAVQSRLLSGLKNERIAASLLFSGPPTTFQGDRQKLITAAADALYASKILSYAQGFSLLRMASAEYDYELKPSEIASIWRAGCIIRATLLDKISAAYQSKPDLPNLLLDEYFSEAVASRQSSLRFVTQAGVGLGIPLLAISSSLAYFDAYRSERLPANLTQAQRDYFGAHTYRRTDREGIFHTEWNGG